MSKFWIWQSSEYDRFSICERDTAFWICQNMPWQSSHYILGPKYVRTLNVELWICLIRYIARSHSTSLREFIERWAYSETCQRAKIERFGKIFIAFTYFCKKHSILNIWEGSKYVSGFEYARVLNFQGYTGYTYFHKYDSVLNMRPGGIMEGFWIFQDTNKPDFCIKRITQGSNMPEYGWLMPE